MKFSYGTRTYLDTLGQPYDTLMCNGIKREGESVPLGHGTVEEAWAAYFTALNAYIADNRATAIEWRVPPQIEKRDLAPPMFAVYSRLSVIERAPRPPAINEGFAT